MIRKNAAGSVGAGDANTRNSSSASAAVAAEPTTVASNPSGLTPPERPRCIGWRVRMLTGSSLLYTPTSDAQVSAVQAASAPADTTNSHGSPVAAKAAAQAKNGRLLASTCRSLRGSPSSRLGFKAWGSHRGSFRLAAAARSATGHEPRGDVRAAEEPHEQKPQRPPAEREGERPHHHGAQASRHRKQPQAERREHDRAGKQQAHQRRRTPGGGQEQHGVQRRHAQRNAQVVQPRRRGRLQRRRHGGQRQRGRGRHPTPRPRRPRTPMRPPHPRHPQRPWRQPRRPLRLPLPLLRRARRTQVPPRTTRSSPRT